MRQKALYDALSIQCQSGTNVSIETSLGIEQWVLATHNSMRALSANINAYADDWTNPDGWKAIEPRLFPCQKSDSGPRCEGWVLRSQNALFAPSQVSPCPCSLGRSSLMAPLLSVAHELSGEFSTGRIKKSFAPRAFQCLSHDSELRSCLMLWLHWAAQRHFQTFVGSTWISQLSKVSLSISQRQSLKWWARMTELSQLTQNQAFSVVTRRDMEQLYQQGQALSIQRAISQLSLKEESLVVLFLNGQELNRSTNQSSRLDWMEALFSALDEQKVGLVLISKHPLLSQPDSVSDDSLRSGFKWKPSQRQEHSPRPFERLLPRGSWDRLLELLARADYLLAQWGKR